MSRHAVAIALAVLSLCACTTMTGRDPLQVAVAGIEPLQGEGLELRFLVKLRVQNPNGTPVVYDGAYVKLEVQDKTFATGVSDAGGTVTGFGESLVEVPVTVSMLRLARQLLGMRGEAPAEQLRYKMSGKLGSHRFSADGEFSMTPPGAEAPVQAN
jgi:LEA14-like dessication related protein